MITESPTVFLQQLGRGLEISIFYTPRVFAREE